MVQVGIWNLNHTVDDRIFLKFTPKYKAGFTQIRIIWLFHSLYLVWYLLRISIIVSWIIIVYGTTLPLLPPPSGICRQLFFCFLDPKK